VYKTEIPENFNSQNKKLVFEDEHCKVYYNFRNIGGNMNFQFYNKTDKNIYLHLDECFFILNGVAFDYFKNRTYQSTIGEESQSLNRLLVSENTISSNRNFYKANSIAIKEDKILVIPFKASKIISEDYYVNSTVFNHCDLDTYPSKEQKNSTVSFNKESSPFVFSSRITYSLSIDSAKKELNHEFYVKEITNFIENEIVKLVTETNCDKQGSTYKYLQLTEKDFFVKYIKTSK
jgi:hypothetical protein